MWQRLHDRAYLAIKGCSAQAWRLKILDGVGFYVPNGVLRRRVILGDYNA